MTIPDIGRRFGAEWQIKLFLGGAITLVFWAGYFLLQQARVAPATEMPLSALDQWIPFCPGAAFLYLSQFITMPVVLWLTPSRRQLLSCCLGLTLLIVASFAVFLFWPTFVARPETMPGQHPLYDLIVRHDLPRNACPSLHAAFGVFTAGYAFEVFRGWRASCWWIGAVWVWTAGVLLSALLIRQHVFLDLLAGGFLGVISVWLTRPRGSATEGRP